MTQQMKLKNIFEGLPASVDKELFETLSSSPGVTIERIVSLGQSTPVGEWLEQERSEWVILLSGSASVCFEENSEKMLLKPGDYLCIPPHTRHRVEHTDLHQPSVWLAIHY
jgi:cupin 2 domain-containing protein